MEAHVRTAVWERAAHRCLLRQEHLAFARFHVEHVVPKKHGGPDSLANLALACDRCNLHKGANVAGLDPLNGELVPLFNPRTQHWKDHFRWEGPHIVGLTGIGRATVQVLNFNAPRRLRLRARLLVSAEM